MNLSKIVLPALFALAAAVTNTTDAAAQCGNSQSVGTSCSSMLSLSCFGDNFNSGESQSLTAALGLPGNDAILLIGTPLAQPVDLSSIGATNCTLYVDTFATITQPLVFDGLASFDITIPSDTTLSNAVFMFQVASPANENPFGVVFTNAIQATVNSLN